MGDAADDQVYLPLGLIDAVALVEDGAEWTMFAMHFAENGLPMFEVNIATLRHAGWVIDSHGESHSLTPPPSASVSTEPPPSGYSLSRIWEGGNCWQATFGEGVGGVVDHQWCTVDHDEIDAGEPLASKSPWRWLFVSGDQRVAGRAESPLQAAAMVEALARVHGSASFTPSPEGRFSRT